MKTKVRIQRSDSGNYRHLYIQILDKRFPDSQLEYVEPIGTLHWQGNVGEDKWYGLSFQIDTDSPDRIAKMAKLAKFIKQNVENRDNPEEVLKVIGAEEYVMYKHEFIPISYRGMIVYDVIDNDKVYSRIFAPNQTMANKILRKRKWNNMSVNAVGVVELPFIKTEF
jgi:hypothetical protein